jgi:hypothetical protein
MRERKAFLLRIDPDLHEALEAWAAQELRSLNGQIEFILKEAVRQRLKEDQGQKDKERKAASERK